MGGSIIFWEVHFCRQKFNKIWSALQCEISVILFTDVLPYIFLERSFYHIQFILPSGLWLRYNLFARC